MEDIPTFKPECDEEIVDKFAKAEPPIEPQDINIVIYRYATPMLNFDFCLSRRVCSHLHFDHIGDLTPFPRTTLVMSKESEVFYPI